jgi:hypothetical protein
VLNLSLNLSLNFSLNLPQGWNTRQAEWDAKRVLAGPLEGLKRPIPGSKVGKINPGLTMSVAAGLVLDRVFKLLSLS